MGRLETKDDDRIEIMFDLPIALDERFARNLTSQLVMGTTESWLFYFGLLEKFKQSGSVLVPNNFSDEDGNRLGGWVANQRSRKVSPRWIKCKN